ncbi:MAG: hypothetical protein HYW28_02125 [Rhodospirillales bacterium]|nr:hypothetical protein [Rhodospirillales bacterium]
MAIVTSLILVAVVAIAGIRGVHPESHIVAMGATKELVSILAGCPLVVNASPHRPQRGLRCLIPSASP